MEHWWVFSPQNGLFWRDSMSGASDPCQNTLNHLLFSLTRNGVSSVSCESPPGVVPASSPNVATSLITCSHSCSSSEDRDNCCLTEKGSMFSKTSPGSVLMSSLMATRRRRANVTPSVSWRSEHMLQCHSRSVGAGASTHVHQGGLWRGAGGARATSCQRLGCPPTAIALCDRVPSLRRTRQRPRQQRAQRAQTELPCSPSREGRGKGDGLDEGRTPEHKEEGQPPP